METMKIPDWINEALPPKMFQQGFKAFYKGQFLCPEEDFDESREWQRGWNAAFSKQYRKTRSIERSRAMSRGV